MISCRTLGPVTIAIEGRPAPAEMYWRKNVALLLYLARSPARRRSRDHLIGLFWADKGESAARHSLREAIRVLRRHVGEEALSTEADQVALVAGAVSLDTDQFEAGVARGDWALAAGLVAGEYCEGFSVPDASAFEDWLSSERLHWTRASVEALVRHGDGRLAAGDALGALVAARRAEQMDAASDPAVRLAMKSLCVGGDRNEALEVFRRHAELLKGKAAGEPDPETRLLAERVRRERAWRVPAYAQGTDSSGGESRRGPLVGRDDALSTLVGTWTAGAAARSARLLIIEADPGVGKTRLAEEVVSRARLEGTTVATVRAVTADRSVPLSGLLGLARGGLLDARGVEGASPGALAALAGELSEWRERFGSALKGTAARPLAAGFGDVVKAGSGDQPILLVVDDAQWMDGGTIASLEALLRDLVNCPVGVLLAAASHPPRPELEALCARAGRDIPGCVVRLTPLDPASVEGMVRWAFPQYGPAETDRLARRVSADSAGIPLLAVELLSAVQSGLELEGESGWPAPFQTLEQTLPGDLPEAIVGAIRVGFRRLSSPAQQVLCAVAVLGERVPAADAGRAAELSGADLQAALDELEWQRWLVAEARGYAFLARIARDVVLRDMMTPGQRQRMIEAGTGRLPPA